MQSRVPIACNCAYGTSPDTVPVRTGCDKWCPATVALLTGTLHRVASDAKRWRGDPAAASAASADGQRAVAEGLAAADRDPVNLGTAMRWQLRELAARLQLQRAKASLAEVQPRASGIQRMEQRASCPLTIQAPRSLFDIDINDAESMNVIDGRHMVYRTGCPQRSGGLP